MSATPTLAERCAAIELLVLDVDGVLTDGQIVYAANGDEIKAFHVRDGSGLVFWQKLGKQVALLTGRTSRVVEIRAQELGIRHVRQGVGDKGVALNELLLELGLNPDQVAAVGDDLPDLPMMRRAGVTFAVADACAEVKSAARNTTLLPGGRGAVREVIELLLKHQGRWDELVSQFTL